MTSSRGNCGWVLDVAKTFGSAGWRATARTVDGAFVSGLPQQVSQLLWALARIDTMTLDQILTWAQAVMINNSPDDGLSEDFAGWFPEYQRPECRTIEDPPEGKAYVVPLWWSIRCKRPASSCSLWDHEIRRESSKRQDELPCDPKWSYMFLAYRCPIRKNLSAFRTWIYVKACLMSVRVKSHVNFTFPQSRFTRGNTTVSHLVWCFRNGQRTKWDRKRKKRRRRGKGEERFVY